MSGYTPVLISQLKTLLEKRNELKDEVFEMSQDFSRACEKRNYWCNPASPRAKGHTEGTINMMATASQNEARQVEIFMVAKQDQLLELEREIAALKYEVLEKEGMSSSQADYIEQDKTELAINQRDHEAAEAQKQRDHELQMAIIQRDTALAQAEAARLAAEANAKAQEQASSSLDALISGVTGNGKAKDGQ